MVAWVDGEEAASREEISKGRRREGRVEGGIGPLLQF